MSSVHQRISAVTTNFNFSMCFSSLGVPGGGAGRSLLSVAGTSARSFYLSLLVIISKPDFYHPFVWGVFKARGLLLWEAGPGSGDFQLPSWPHVEHPHFLQLSPRTPATLLLVSHPHPDHSPVKIQTSDTTLIPEALSERTQSTGRSGGESVIDMFLHLSGLFPHLSFLLHLCLNSMDVDPGPLPACRSWVPHKE